MTVTTHWVNEPWIFAVNLSEYVTMDDIRSVIGECVPLLREHPIYFLIDMSSVSGFDSHILEMSSLSEWIFHPNSRWFVYVRPTGLFKSIMKARQRGNFKAIDDRDAALEFLRRAAHAEQSNAQLF
ncbi:MAG: hypothetical protein R3E39_31705 [Anaerolineae bacterium]